MSDTMYLQGAEAVQSAGRSISLAADSMSQSARWLGEMFDREHDRRLEVVGFFEDFVKRIEAAMGHPLVVLERAPTPTREEELRARDDKWKGVRELVEDQLNDEGLWFIAQTAPEDYVQKALRKLHALIEATAAP